MSQITRCAFLVSMLLTPLACGGESEDDKGGGSSTVESGLADDKPINMLTQTEVDQLGKSYAEAASSPEFIDAVCKFTGVLLGGALPGAGGGASGPSCQDLVNDCKMQAASNPAMVTSQSAAPLPAQATAFAMCDITVGELEGCLTASLKALTTVFGSLSCDSDPNMMAAIDLTAGDIGSLMECQSLNTKCPTLIADAQDAEF